MNKLNSGTNPLAALFVLATFAPALTAQLMSTNVRLLLSRTVLVPLSDGSLDTVTFTGKVHVQAAYPATPPSQYRPTDPIPLAFTLDQVFGEGADTGNKYVAHETIIIKFPVHPNTATVRFNLTILSPHMNSRNMANITTTPLDITFLLTFNPDTGKLSNVTIESMSVQVPG